MRLEYNFNSSKDFSELVMQSFKCDGNEMSVFKLLLKFE